jgi:hypothetical protein
MLGPVRTLFQTLVKVARDLVALIASAMRSRAQLAAENLFLRKQLALYLERQMKCPSQKSVRHAFQGNAEQRSVVAKLRRLPDVMNQG